MLTLIISTKNRSDFLIRLLYYYAETHYKHWIFIGDSSNSEHVERTKRAIKELDGRLKITYNEYPELNEPQCTVKLIGLVSTPFIAWLPDDDFLVPNGMEQCVRFLEKHPGYTVALGKSILLNLQSSGPYGKIKSLGKYGLRSIELDNAQERILNHLSNYSNPNFGVRRTEHVRVEYRNVPSLSDNSFTEMLPNCVSVIRGKIKQLDCLYLVRQCHDQRYLLPDVFDWITSENWHPSYKIFCGILIRSLVDQDGVDEGTAHNTVKHAFWGYLSKGIITKYNHYYGGGQNGIFQRIKNVAKQVHCVRSAYNILRSMCYPSKHLSLPVLLSKRSPYHKDFMPIYRAVTINPKNYKEIQL